MSTTRWSVAYVSAQLNKVYCGGKIGQVKLGPNLEVRAVSDDRSVLVLWQGDEKYGLGKDVGVLDLRLLLQSLSRCGEYADVYMDEHRLVLDGVKTRSSARLVTAHPDQISTTVDPQLIPQIEDMFGNQSARVVPTDVLDEVASALRILRTETLRLIIQGEFSRFVVGSGSENIAEISAPEIAPDDVDEAIDYTLTLPAETFNSVVSSLVEGKVSVRLSGPDSLVEFSQGSMRYILSPIQDEG